jgi:hypothetical protein
LPDATAAASAVADNSASLNRACNMADIEYPLEAAHAKFG